MEEAESGKMIISLLKDNWQPISGKRMMLREALQKHFTWEFAKPDPPPPHKFSHLIWLSLIVFTFNGTPTFPIVQYTSTHRRMLAL